MADTGWVAGTVTGEIADGGTKAWVNESNITADDTSYASLSGWITANSVSYTIFLKNFAFGIPSGATIDGIQVRVNAQSKSSNKGSAYKVQLYKGGSLGGSDLGDDSDFSNTAFQTKTFGSSTNLWGRTWTDTDLNSTSNFGVGFKTQQASGGGSTACLDLDFIEVKVYYTEAGINITTNTASLSITENAMTVQQDVDINITSALDTLAITEYGMTVQQDVDTNITTNVDTLTFTGHGMTVQQDVDINITTATDALTFTTYDMTVQQDVDTNISTNLDTLSITTYGMTVQVGNDINISTNLDTLTITEYAMDVQVGADINISTNLDTLSITEYAMTVQQDVDTNITTSTDTLAFTTYGMTVDVTNDINISSNLDTLTLTTYPATVNQDSDINITTATDALTFTTYDMSLVVGETEAALTTYRFVTHTNKTATVVHTNKHSYTVNY